LSGKKGEPSTFLSLSPGNACSSLSFLPSCVFEKWAPCVLKEAKKSPRGSLPLESNVMQDSLGWQSSNDEHWKVDDEEVSDQV
jgi:hypothetical protein